MCALTILNLSSVFRLDSLLTSFYIFLHASERHDTHGVPQGIPHQPTYIIAYIRTLLKAIYAFKIVINFSTVAMGNHNFWQRFFGGGINPPNTTIWAYVRGGGTLHKQHNIYRYRAGRRIRAFKSPIVFAISTTTTNDYTKLIKIDRKKKDLTQKAKIELWASETDERKTKNPQCRGVSGRGGLKLIVFLWYLYASREEEND